MKTFKEYLLDEKVLKEQTVHMPPGTSIVNVRKTGAGLMLLALTTPEAYVTNLPEIRTFKICANGEIFIAPTVKYIGSFESVTGIKHVVEIIKEF